MAQTRTCRSALSCILLAAAPVAAWQQTAQSQSVVPNRPLTVDSSSSHLSVEQAKEDMDSCRVHQIASLPGSHKFPSEFIEAVASDPDAQDPDEIWGLTTDTSTQIPSQNRAMYISKSADGGATWTQVARIDSRYFDAEIGEGLRNGFIVSPGAAYFLITTQRGAFQVFPQQGTSEATITPVIGPRVPATPPKMPITKKPGDPVRANVIDMTADGQHLIIGYGYFDRDPKIFTYSKDGKGSWIEDQALPGLPTDMDLLSIEFDNPQNPNPGYLYVGTGDQVYLLNRRTGGWSRVHGVGPDSAIHGMSVVGGLHLAACWGVYNPAGPGIVRRVTEAKFLLHRTSDEAGSNLRAYSIEVDPRRTNREVVTSITGVYTSQDKGETWRRLNDLPEGEYRLAHFNSDGTILVSGMPGTFLVNPFSETCFPHLKTRGK